MTTDHQENSTADDSRRTRIVERVKILLNTLNHICIGFVAIYMSWFCCRFDLVKLPLHVWLVTLGFCLLMAEAIMSHYDGNVLMYSYRRKTKTMIHWVLMVLGGGCGLAGCLVIMIERKFSFSTVHGKYGLAAFVLCLISMSSGLSAFFSLRLQCLLKPLHNKTFHNFLGIVTFILAMIAQFYGYEKSFFSKQVGDGFETLMKSITLMTIVLTCIGPLASLRQKFLNICER